MADATNTTQEMFSKLMDARDRLNQVSDLVEAIFMAAVGIGERKHTAAIQSVCEFADDRLDEIGEIIDDVRGSLK